MANLSPKRRAFVKAYKGEARGNATLAAKLAGYKQPTVQGCRLLTNVNVRDAIGAEPVSNRHIASPEELQSFWTGVLEGTEDPDAKMMERLKASELLAKCKGMFLERREITGKDGGPISVRDETAALSDEEIEARLTRLRKIAGSHDTGGD